MGRLPDQSRCLQDHDCCLRVITVASRDAVTGVPVRLLSPPRVRHQPLTLCCPSRCSAPAPPPAGTAYNCARAVQVVSPYVVALALESHGLQGALSVPMGLALAMSAWVWVFPETKDIRLPEWESKDVDDVEPALVD